MIPVTMPERRLHPRTTLARLAYIHIEPDNGGIILNVSREGLCFHAVAPIAENGPVVICMVDRNRLIESGGEVMWTDPRQKNAGVRFTSLSFEARRQIEECIRESEVTFKEDFDPASAFSLPEECSENDARQPRRSECAAASAVAEVLVSQPEPAEPKLAQAIVSQPQPYAQPNAPILSKPTPAQSPEPSPLKSVRVRAIPAGFAAAVFILAFTATIFLFSYAPPLEQGDKPEAYRQELIATHPEPPSEPPAAVAQAALPQTEPVASNHTRSDHPQPLPVAAGQSATKPHRPASMPVLVAVNGTPTERVAITGAPQVVVYPVAPSPGLTGKVSLKLIIGADGAVSAVEVLKGNRALADASVQAIRHWHYPPPELNGSAAEGETNVTVSFVGTDAVTVSFR